jgi:hypothetical protein
MCMQSRKDNYCAHAGENNSAVREKGREIRKVISY